MRSLTTARQRADQFAAATDGHAHVKLDAESEDLLALVTQLRAVPGPTLNPDFATDLRTRLVAAAGTELVAPSVAPIRAASPRTPQRGGRRVLPIAAAVCIITSSSMGVAAASQAALPGDALYPVKRGIENISVSIAGSPLDRGHVYVGEATTRLWEAQAVAVRRADEPQSPTLIAATLNDFTVEAKHAAHDLMIAYRKDASPRVVADLRAFTRSSASQLQALSFSVKAMPSAAPDVVEQLTGAAQVVTRIDRTALQTCPSCSALPPLTFRHVLPWQHHVPGPSNSPANRPGHHSAGGGKGHPVKHEPRLTQPVPTSASGSVSPTPTQSPSASVTTDPTTSPVETTDPTSATSSPSPSPTASATTSPSPTATEPTTTAPATTDATTGAVSVSPPDPSSSISISVPTSPSSTTP